MTSADRGSKHRCNSCGAPFYDLNRHPIVCPKCEAPFTPEERLARSPVRARTSRAARPPVEVEAPAEAEREETEDAEVFDEDEILVRDEDEDETFTGGDEAEDGDEMRE